MLRTLLFATILALALDVPRYTQQQVYRAIDAAKYLGNGLWRCGLYTSR